MTVIYLSGEKMLRWDVYTMVSAVCLARENCRNGGWKHTGRASVQIEKCIAICAKRPSFTVNWKSTTVKNVLPYQSLVLGSRLDATAEVNEGRARSMPKAVPLRSWRPS
jgi:hypothetical protein